MRIKKLFYALVPMLFLAMGACQEEPVQAPAINLNEDEISIGAEGGESSVLIKPTRDWTATVENGADWLTVNPASGSSADVVVEVKVVAEANEGDARSAKITFTAANIEEVLTVSQAAVSGGGNEPGGDDEGVITVEEFLSKPVDGSVYYRLKGTITDLFNTEYGNFHLVDSTGDVLVYGLTAEKQSSNDKSFSTLGLEEGDIVILEGTRDEYNGEPQVGGAYYISHEDGQGGGDDPQPGEIEEVTVSEFLSKPVDGSVYYRLTGEITDLYNTSYGNFTLVDETGSVLVYGLTAEKVSSNDQSFSTLGLKEGDIVTLEGTRAEYNGEAQVGGPAYYISHEEGETPDIPEGDPKALIISEYSEGKSFNKFLEITNVSGNEIDLSAYTLRIYTNGSESNFKEQQLNGTLAAGASKVYMHSDADASLLPAGVNAEAINDNVINFNGNDPMAIICNSAIVDVIGTIGDSGDYGKDTTLRRKSTVKEPSSTYNMDEWEVFPLDELSGFGSHVID